jgi:SagB-type dehydrogenase family enzyme
MLRKSPAKPETLVLPSPRLRGATSLEEALVARRSVRSFSGRDLSPEELSQLLWSAQGITNSEGDRTAPSAGGLLPLETYVVSAEGVFRYDPPAHRLERISHVDLRPQLFRAALEQEPVLRAPVTVVLAAVYQRTASKYGARRSRRYVHMEVGHAAQNLLLQAVALGLGAVVIGAFEDDRVQAALSLPADHQPLYLIPVGEARHRL